MIDTLKLAHRLEAARMPREQADAVTAAIDESLREQAYVTRDYLDIKLGELKKDLISELTWRTLLLMIGVVGVLNGTVFWAISTLLRK